MSSTCTGGTHQFSLTHKPYFGESCLCGAMKMDAATNKPVPREETTHGS